MIRHHFTVDVEEAFHSTALDGHVPPDTWDSLPRRAATILPWVLELLAETGSHATFFVLGWMAEREPALIRTIAEHGHEIAGHTWDHRLVTTQTPEEFRTSIRRTKRVLEDLTGIEVSGFRAPSFSIRPGVEWALDVLLEEGYRYDSSLFPISIHPGYGYPGGSVDAHAIERSCGTIWEVPPLTLGVPGGRLPAAGGAYLRFFPYALMRSAMRQAEARGREATIYVHPWDLDPDAERLDVPPLLKLRLYGGTRGARRRVERLLREFRFASVAETLGLHRERAP